LNAPETGKDKTKKRRRFYIIHKKGGGGFRKKLLFGEGKNAPSWEKKGWLQEPKAYFSWEGGHTDVRRV